MPHTRPARSRLRFALAVAIAYSAFRQAPAQTTQVTTIEAKPLAFEVVSVRENKNPPIRGNPFDAFGPTPDGFRAVNESLLLALITAYVPAAGDGSFFTPDRISGMADWTMQERYDLTAKVAEADLPEWQKPASQPGMLRAMLQTFFIERCKVQVHRETKEGPVSFLVLAKGGPKFKETDPAEEHTGMRLAFGGGVIAPSSKGMGLYNATMGGIAALLGAQMGEQVVIDKTGLTGHYDLLLKTPESQAPGFDRQDVLQQQLDELGLKLQPGKAPVERLVIDHMERPSAN